MVAKIRELIEKRNRLVQQGRDLYAKVEQEKRSMTDEEKKNDEARFADIADIGEQIKRFERQLELERVEASRSINDGRAEDTAREADEEERSHRSRVAKLAPYLSRFMSVRGEDGNPTLRFSNHQIEVRASKKYYGEFETYLRTGAETQELRALAADNAVSGGYLLAPIETVIRLIQAVDDQVFIRQAATKHLVLNADGLGMASLDADPADSDWTSELGTGSEGTMTFGRRELRPHPLAKRIKVSNKLMRTSTVSAEQLVQSRLAYKFGVTGEKAFLTGSGANQPLGVFVATADGVPTSQDSLTGSGTGITMDGIYDAKFALKGAYWNRPSTAWMFHRTGVKLISKLKDSTNQYLWQPSVQAGQPDRLLGIPVVMSEFVPNTFTSGLYVGMLADWSYYHIADSLNLTIQRLNELYAETNQTGYIGRMEFDGMPTLAEAFVRLKTN